MKYTKLLPQPLFLDDRKPAAALNDMADGFFLARPERGVWDPGAEPQEADSSL